MLHLCRSCTISQSNTSVDKRRGSSWPMLPATSRLKAGALMPIPILAVESFRQCRKPSAIDIVTDDKLIRRSGREQPDSIPDCNVT